MLGALGLGVSVRAVPSVSRCGAGRALPSPPLPGPSGAFPFVVLVGIAKDSCFGCLASVVCCLLVFAVAALFMITDLAICEWVLCLRTGVGRLSVVVLASCWVSKVGSVSKGMYAARRI